TRTSFVDDLPPGTVLAIFALEEPGETTVVSAGDTVVLVRLVAVTDVDPTQDTISAAVERLQAQRDATVALDMLDLFSRAVQARVEVDINRTAINQINSQIMGVAP
ncbi:MAG: hypothetical protein AAF631_07320, partial [Pseudomonadota bacterium]